MMTNTLKQHAQNLRLSGLFSSLEVRLQEAEANRLPYAQFLELLFQDEIDVRHQRMLARRHKSADFREPRSLENFDFSFNLWTARVDRTLCPLAALLTQHRRSAHPITARGENWSAEAARSEGAAEFAGFHASVHPDLLHALVEDPHATAIPAYPDFVADQFGWRLVKGFFYFHVAVPMYAAPGFLEAGKKRRR
jgi:hypothetical protein